MLSGINSTRERAHRFRTVLAGEQVGEGKMAQVSAQIQQKLPVNRSLV